MGGRFFGVNFLTGVLYKECTGVQYLYSLTAHRGIVHMGTHRVHRGTQGYTGVHRGTQGYTGVHRGTVHRGTQGYTGVLYTGVLRGTQGYTGVHNTIKLYTQGCSEAHRQNPLYHLYVYRVRVFDV